MSHNPTRPFVLCSLVLALLGACSQSQSNEAARSAGTASGGAAGSGAGAPVFDDEAEPAFGGAATAGTGGTSGGLIGASGGTGASGDFSSAEGIAAGASGGDGDGDSDSDAGVVQSGTLTAGVWDDNRNFDRFSDYRSELLQGGLDGALPTTDAEHAAALAAYAQPHGARAKLDVALVIDTTGSMADEIRYLQTELLAISSAIGAQYPNADQRWSLVAYRDEGDVYLVRSFDFAADLEQVRAELADLSADGGGDFPEAPDAALAATNTLAWRTGDDVARLAFWVADAPHHAEKAAALADAIRDAHELDLHVYPVASSGVDELTELTMRSAAQLTGGRYLFLTNDSGVGGDHKEPTIPCYFVTHLDDAILRMVDIELSGEYREPVAEDILRTGGDPQDGACTLDDGEELQAF